MIPSSTPSPTVPFASPVRDALPTFADRLNLHERLEPYAALRWTEATVSWPVLHVEDVSGIPFLSEIHGFEEYQHRARVHATGDDLYATVTPPDPDYDAYCTDELGLGAPRWIDVGNPMTLYALPRDA